MVVAAMGSVAHIVVIFVFRLVHMPAGIPASVAVSIVVSMVVRCCCILVVNSSSWITGDGGGGALMLKVVCWNSLFLHLMRRWWLPLRLHSYVYMPGFSMVDTVSPLSCMVIGFSLVAPHTAILIFMVLLVYVASFAGKSSM